MTKSTNLGSGVSIGMPPTQDTSGILSKNSEGLKVSVLDMKTFSVGQLRVSQVSLEEVEIDVSSIDAELLISTNTIAFELSTHPNFSEALRVGSEPLDTAIGGLITIPHALTPDIKWYLRPMVIIEGMEIRGSGVEVFIPLTSVTPLTPLNPDDVAKPLIEALGMLQSTWPDKPLLGFRSDTAFENGDSTSVVLGQGPIASNKDVVVVATYPSLAVNSIQGNKFYDPIMEVQFSSDEEFSNVLFDQEDKSSSSSWLSSNVATPVYCYQVYGSGSGGTLLPGAYFVRARTIGGVLKNPSKTSDWSTVKSLKVFEVLQNKFIVADQASTWNSTIEESSYLSTKMGDTNIIFASVTGKEFYSAMPPPGQMILGYSGVVHNVSFSEGIQFSKWIQTSTTQFGYLTNAGVIFTGGAIVTAGYSFSSILDPQTYMVRITPFPVVTFFSTSGSVIASKSIKAFAEESTMTFQALRENSSKTSAIFVGGCKHVAINSTKSSAIFAYSSSPSTGSLISKLVYEVGNESTLYNCCFTGDGNLVGVGANGASGATKATIIKVDSTLTPIFSLRIASSSYAGSFFNCVPSSTVNTGVYACGRTSTASGIAALVSYSTDSHQWSKLYKMANNANSNKCVRMAEDATRIYCILNNTVSSDSGFGIMCLDKLTGDVIWAKKTNRVNRCLTIYDIQIIGTEVLVCGIDTLSPKSPIVASFSSSTGDVNYLKQAYLARKFTPLQILGDSEGYTLTGRTEEFDVRASVAFISNPHLSEDFKESVEWAFVPLTPYLPADTLSITSPTLASNILTVENTPYESSSTGCTLKDTPGLFEKYLSVGVSPSFYSVSTSAIAVISDQGFHTIDLFEQTLVTSKGGDISGLGGLGVYTNTAVCFAGSNDAQLIFSSPQGVPIRKAGYSGLAISGSGKVRPGGHIGAWWSHTWETTDLYSAYGLIVGMSSVPSGGSVVGRRVYDANEVYDLHASEGCLTNDNTLMLVGNNYEIRDESEYPRTAALLVRTKVVSGTPDYLSVQSQYLSWNASEGAGASYLTHCVSSPSVNNGAYAGGHVNVEYQEGAIVLYSLEFTVPWCKVYKFSETSEERCGLLGTGPGYVYLVLDSKNTNALSGFAIVCLNSTTGAVIWAKKTTRTDKTLTISALKAVGSELIVCGKDASTGDILLSSFVASSGAVNYVKQQLNNNIKGINFTKIEAIQGGYAIMGGRPAPVVVMNPHTSPSFGTSDTWGFTSFTPYSLDISTYFSFGSAGVDSEPITFETLTSPTISDVAVTLIDI
jgi:hypothetical protein